MNKTLKHDILKLFQSGKTLYFSDIALALNADLEKVVEVCKELLAEGKIFIQK